MFTILQAVLFELKSQEEDWIFFYSVIILILQSLFIFDMFSSVVNNLSLRFSMHDVKRDGNCLSRSTSCALWGNEDKHDVVRQQAVQQIICDWEELQAYVYNPRTNDLFESRVEYKQFMGSDGEYGSFVEILACSRKIIFIK